ncbi:MAG: hypothetical protein K8F30_13665, partial [Taibaiella sp.]|nr:hypothetical protein [Taibaiella sp.]
YEKMDNYSFIIFRIYGDNGSPEMDTMQELTNKVAIFYSPAFVITVHREKEEFLDKLREQVQANKCNSSAELLNAIIYGCLKTYQDPLKRLSEKVDRYEEFVFLKHRKIQSLKGLYYLKRKIDLIRRMLILSYEIIDEIDPDGGNVDTRETRDEYIKLQHLFDSLSENIHQLLTVYFSTASQRTNEIMRVLTIFSVFFMPLTFIVGIYGMNFDYMPEIGWKPGYPTVMVLMAAITVAIYFYFKRKDWL